MHHITLVTTLPGMTVKRQDGKWGNTEHASAIVYHQFQKHSRWLKPSLYSGVNIFESGMTLPGRCEMSLAHFNKTPALSVVAEAVEVTRA